MGAQQVLGVVLTWVLEVLTILDGGHKRFPPFKKGGGAKKFYSVLRGGGGAGVPIL